MSENIFGAKINPYYYSWATTAAVQLLCWALNQYKIRDLVFSNIFGLCSLTGQFQLLLNY